MGEQAIYERPADFDFSQVLHPADERLPVEAVEFEAKAIYAVIRQMGGVVV